MDASIRDAVFVRAGFRCEYCHVETFAFPRGSFHVEHVIPRQHRGEDSLANLALACLHCNLHKGPNLAGLDPVTGTLTPLFNPRNDQWDAHFEICEHYVRGLTAIGRTTVEVQAMNTANRLRLRSEIADR
jgi:hypothetical protein